MPQIQGVVNPQVSESTSVKSTMDGLYKWFAVHWYKVTIDLGLSWIIQLAVINGIYKFKSLLNKPQMFYKLYRDLQKPKRVPQMTQGTINGSTYKTRIVPVQIGNLFPRLSKIRV